MDDDGERFGGLNIKQLKEELKRRGASLFMSGRKKDLVERYV